MRENLARQFWPSIQPSLFFWSSFFFWTPFFSGRHLVDLHLHHQDHLRSKPTGPNRERRREDLPARGGSSDRGGATRQVSQGREASDPRGFRPKPLERDQSRLRPRIFEPDIPEEITGEELEKSVRAELLSLSAENAKVVARHLVSINIHMDSDPELAHKHGIAAAHHAGRLAVVRESAGYAAYRAGYYEIALKELRAAHRISGDVSMWPVMADCERGLR
jgi:hypothetical protein